MKTLPVKPVAADKENAKEEALVQALGPATPAGAQAEKTCCGGCEKSAGAQRSGCAGKG